METINKFHLTNLLMYRRKVKPHILYKRKVKSMKQNQLHGENNKRANTSKPITNESTAAWCDSDKVLRDSGVAIPSEQGVENAKEWVDNGSRL
jgi:hypothetical protein